MKAVQVFEGDGQHRKPFLITVGFIDKRFKDHSITRSGWGCASFHEHEKDDCADLIKRSIIQIMPGGSLDTAKTMYKLWNQILDRLRTREPGTVRVPGVHGNDDLFVRLEFA